MSLINDILKYNLLNILSNFYFLLFKFNQNCLLNRSISNNSIVNNKISKFYSTEEFGFYLAGLLEGDKYLPRLNYKLINIVNILPVIKKRYYTINEFNKLPTHLDEILIGLLLGDVCASRGSKNTRLFFEQGDIHKNYLLHLYDLFKDYCKTEPKSTCRYDYRTNKNYKRIKFSTLRLPVFNYYHEIFYLNNKKIVPKNLDKILTAKYLAYWSMDDGSKTGKGFRLNTQSFTKDENLILIQILKDKFNLDCSLHFHNKKNNQYRIYIKTKSMPDLKNLIYPYFHESLLYKLK
jgi:hypothetical protein